MFEDCLVESAGKIKTKKSRTVAVSATLHGLLIVILILVPLVFTDQIEGAKLTSILLEPPPPPTAPPPAPAIAAAKPAVPEILSVDPAAFIEPLFIPKEIATIVDTSPGPSDAIGVPYGVPYGSDRSRTPSIFMDSPRPPTVIGPPPAATPPPSPPPPPPTMKYAEPLRVSGPVQAGKVIYQPSPAYPSLARIAKVEGTVVLQATIGVDGTIQSLRIISETSPLLRTGVIETVKTWKYKPTLLSNEPVEVITTITINFNLNRDSR